MKIVIGHALIWCLYCDWMTGVWSLGTEMLRNVESFWYPIRLLVREVRKAKSIFQTLIKDGCMQVGTCPTL